MRRYGTSLADKHRNNKINDLTYYLMPQDVDLTSASALNEANAKAKAKAVRLVDDITKSIEEGTKIFPDTQGVQNMFKNDPKTFKQEVKSYLSKHDVDTTNLTDDQVRSISIIIAGMYGWHTLRDML